MKSQEISFEARDVDASEFASKADQKLLFLEKNSFLACGGHLGDDSRLYEPEGEPSKQGRQILVSEIVFDTVQFPKETDEDLMSEIDCRFKDLYPHNNGRSSTGSNNEVVFKGCVSNYTQTDIHTKCNTPLILNRKQPSLESQTQIPKSNQLIMMRQGTIHENSDQQPSQIDVSKAFKANTMDFSNKDNTDKTEIIYDSQQVSGQDALKSNSKLQRKKTSINISNVPKSVEVSKPSESIQSQDLNNLRSTATPAVQSKFEEKFFKGIQIIQNQLKSEQTKAMKKERIVSKFVNVLYNLIPKRQMRHFENSSMNLINDVTTCFEIKGKEINQNSSLNILLNIFNQLFAHIFKTQFLFFSNSVTMNAWNIFCFFSALLFVIVYSISMAYCKVLEGDNYMNYIFIIPLLILSSDILFGFNTAIYFKDTIITDKVQIREKYLKSGFLFHIFSMLSLIIKVILFNNYSSSNFNLSCAALDFLIIFQWISILHSHSKHFTEQFPLSANQENVLKIIKILFYDLLLAHLVVLNYWLDILYYLIVITEMYIIVTVSWIYLNNFENQLGETKTWLSNLGLNQKEWLKQYLLVFYWSIASITNVGVDGLSPQNNVELILASFSLIILSCAFVYSAITIGIIIWNIQKEDTEFTNLVRTLQSYLRRKNVDVNIISRAKNYLNYLKEENKDINKEKEDNIIQHLSLQLQEDIIKETHTKLFYQISLFLSNFSFQTNSKLIYMMEEIIVNPNQVIFLDGELDDQSIYFIADGAIEIYHTRDSVQGKQQTVRVLTQNSYFGEISFFSGNNRSASARSVNLSTLYKITRQNFLDIISQKEKDFERYKMIQESIIFEKNLTCIRVQCYGCQQLGHIVKHCPKLHSHIDCQALVLRKNFSQYAQRNIYYRRPKSRVNTNARLRVYFNNEIVKKLKQDLHFSPTMYEILEVEDEDEDITASECEIRQTTYKDTSYHDEDISIIEEISQKLPKQKSIKNLSAQIKKEILSEKDSLLSQLQIKEIEYNSNLNSNNNYSQLSPVMPSFCQDLSQEQITQFLNLSSSQSIFSNYLFNQLNSTKEQLVGHTKINSELTKTYGDDEYNKRISSIFRKESVEKNKSFRDISKRTNSSEFQSLTILPSKDKSINIISNNEYSSINGDFDKKYICFMESNKDPSICAMMKDMSSAKKRLSSDVFSSSMKSLQEKKLSQSNILNILNQKGLLQQFLKQNVKGVYSSLDCTSTNDTIMNCFDKLKQFNKFFPHNNFASIQKQQLKLLKKRTKSFRFYRSLNLKQNTSNQFEEPQNQYKDLDREIIELYKENDILSKMLQITSISYGVGERSNQRVPNRYLFRKQVL